MISTILYEFFYKYFKGKRVNILLFIPRRIEKIQIFLQPANRGRPARKFSLSPVRRAQLPGTSDVEFIDETSLVDQTVPSLVGQPVPQLNQIGNEARRHTTVLSPIKKPYKNNKA